MTTAPRLETSSRRAVLLGLVALAVLPPRQARADDAAKAFLDAIYQTYLKTFKTSRGEGPGIAIDDNRSIRRYFTASTATLIIQDGAKAAKRGDVPELDGDPFIGQQDWEITDYKIDVVDLSPTTATGTVTFTDSGESKKIVLDLVKAGADWRIHDVHWADGETLRGLYVKK